MLTCVLSKWRRQGGWSVDYGPERVNAVVRMLASHLHVPYKVVCVTDDPDGVECETIPMFDAPVKAPAGRPNCYHRLRYFSKEMLNFFGPRFVSIDLDCVILPGVDGTGITPILDRKEDFIIVNGWRNDKGCCPYNGSMWMMNTGCRAEVYETFDINKTPTEIERLKLPNGKRWFGSDQCVIAKAIPDESTWSDKDGVMSFSREGRIGRRFPRGCRIMFFAGVFKPWSSHIKNRHPHIWEEYKKYL